MKIHRFEQQDIDMCYVSDLGMTVELVVNAKRARDSDSVAHPLFKILADEQTEALYLEIESHGKLVQVPVSSIMEMLAAAKIDVHSEHWFDEHVFKQGGS